jgi:hypothetical protein
VTLDPTAITRIERGQRSVSLTEAVAFAAVLGASVDEMCAGGPASTERELRRELAETEAQIANAEAALASANYTYAELRSRADDLRAKVADAAWEARRRDGGQEALA